MIYSVFTFIFDHFGSFGPLKWAHQGVLGLHFDFHLVLLHKLTIFAQIIWQIIFFEIKVIEIAWIFLIFTVFLPFAASLMGPQGAPDLFLCFTTPDNSFLTQNIPPLGHLRRNNNKNLIILAIFSYFCHLGGPLRALKGP